MSTDKKDKTVNPEKEKKKRKEENKEKKEKKEERVEEKKILDANETALFAVSLLEQKAWISLGLVKDADNEFHKSKEDARFLIDLLIKMADHFESVMDEKIVKELRNQISTLQLNFVNQFKS